MGLLMVFLLTKQRKEKWRLSGKMDTLEVILWILFLITISLLFFAAFGAEKVSSQTIEEYMENLVSEEQGSRGT